MNNLKLIKHIKEELKINREIINLVLHEHKSRTEYMYYCGYELALKELLKVVKGGFKQ